VRLIDELRAEHDLIERVLGSLRTYVDERLRGGADPRDAASFIRFLRLYAGHYHHAREEATLFAALADVAGLPRDRGPVAVLSDDHRGIAGLLDALDDVLDTQLVEEGAGDRLRTRAREYWRALAHHIDAENSVLFPEGEHRLRKHAVVELPSRPIAADEEEARGAGEALTRRYPPSADRDAIRGDGCVLCPSFGERCGGIEREWWNESEWEEFEDHLPAG
jgi:hemerythrin-like domain-containing protein